MSAMLTQACLVVGAFVLARTLYRFVSFVLTIVGRGSTVKLTKYGEWAGERPWPVAPPPVLPAPYFPLAPPCPRAGGCTPPCSPALAAPRLQLPTSHEYRALCAALPAAASSGLP